MIPSVRAARPPSNEIAPEVTPGIRTLRHDWTGPVEKPFTTGKDMIGKVTRDPADGPAITLLANEHDSCFAAGTLVLTNAGPKSIEQVEPGELVLSVDEHDPNGSAEWKRVEQAYHNAPAELLNVHIGEGVIRTTFNPSVVRPSAKAGSLPRKIEIGDELRQRKWANSLSSPTCSPMGTWSRCI